MTAHATERQPEQQPRQQLLSWRDMADAAMKRCEVCGAPTYHSPFCADCAALIPDSGKPSGATP